MSPVGNLTIQCMTILNGIVGPGLAGVLTEMNSVVEVVSFQFSPVGPTPNPPVMNIVLSDNYNMAIYLNLVIYTYYICYYLLSISNINSQ